MPPPRREPGEGGNISFAHPVGKKNNDPDDQSVTEYGTWIQRIMRSYDYFGRSNDVKIGAWTRRTAGNYRVSSNSDGREFKWLAQQEEDYSGDTSPPLWEEASSPCKEQPSESYPIRKSYHHHGNRLYPTSRSQTIAKYRQEMMEMVQDVPETAYELSLRDLVELPKKARPEEENSGKGREPSEDAKGREKKDKTKTKKGKKQILRSESMDNGAFLLKMFFPMSLGGRRRSSGAATTGSKVSPKPILLDGVKCGSENCVDGSCKTHGYCEMSRSSSTNSSGRRRKISGCYPFFNTNKGKTRGY